jgi:hypothetical protein
MFCYNDCMSRRIEIDTRPKPVEHPKIKERRQRVANKRVMRGILGAGTAVVVAGTLSSGKLFGSDTEPPTTPPTPDELTVCIPEGSQQFTFEAGQGEDNAIHAIEGSGQGESDPCWSEAKQAVEGALSRDMPQYHETITIPQRVVPDPSKTAHQNKD